MDSSKVTRLLLLTMAVVSGSGFAQTIEPTPEQSKDCGGNASCAFCTALLLEQPGDYNGSQTACEAANPLEKTCSCTTFWLRGTSVVSYHSWTSSPIPEQQLCSSLNAYSTTSFQTCKEFP
jgi:hypothetical protein